MMGRKDCGFGSNGKNRGKLITTPVLIIAVVLFPSEKSLFDHDLIYIIPNL